MESSPTTQVAYHEASEKESESHDVLLAPDKPRKKFFWWHMTKKQRILVILGLVLLLLLLLFLILWFAVIPAVIRHYVRSVKLSVNYMDVVRIPDNNTITVDLSLNIQHDIGIAATTDNTTVSMLYGGAEFATLPFPGLRLKTGFQNYNLTIDADMPITDLEAFNAMADALMKESEITLTSIASLDINGLGMSFHDLKLKRDLPVEGFVGFSDPEPVIENIELATCSSSEYLININVTLNNTAQMGLDGIGVLNVSVYNGQEYLGYALSQKPELGIPRGMSNQSYRITMDADNVSISSLILSALAGSVQFYIVGNNPYVTTHGQFKEALTNVNMSVPASAGALATMKVGPSCNLSSLLS
ncbi:hypothetical protein PHMEG_0001828 [Phytophthora megakarya]|uniref:Late embryogenesis abundant protein LEA-2 subgroup domain-containing protein n=1 Tax=Phytophthora megakarya TaxID=4795 RepID=A0A225X297_9STRA|nr:hypothetical protein PHMEG_0001828 [Phytophthora megakarya]